MKLVLVAAPGDLVKDCRDSESSFHRKARQREKTGIKAVSKGPGTRRTITIFWQEWYGQETLPI